MQEKLHSISNNLESILRNGKSSQVQEQLFDGRHWEEFNRAMEAHFGLFSIEGDCDRLKWLVLSVTTRVKMEWAKCLDHNS